MLESICLFFVKGGSVGRKLVPFILGFRWRGTGGFDFWCERGVVWTSVDTSGLNRRRAMWKGCRGEEFIKTAEIAQGTQRGEDRVRQEFSQRGKGTARTV